MIADAMLGVNASNQIERMEADGQRQLSQSSQLPTSGLDALVKAIPAIRVIGVSEGDSTFSDVELPAGWHVQPTDHAMWSDLRDDKDRKRAGIFYKAAYYDRRADIHVIRRFSIERDYSSPNYLTECAYVVTDGGKQVWRTRVEVLPERGDWQASEAIETVLRAEAAAWLEPQFPNWQDASAYWD
jgi:hypothetical protein